MYNLKSGFAILLFFLITGCFFGENNNSSSDNNVATANLMLFNSRELSYNQVSRTSNTDITFIEVNIRGEGFKDIKHSLTPETPSVLLKIPAGKSREVEVIIETPTFVYKGSDIRDYSPGKEYNLIIFLYLTKTKTANVNVSFKYLGDPPTNISSVKVNVIGDNFATITKSYNFGISDVNLEIPAGNSRTIELITDTGVFVYRGIDVRNYLPDENISCTINLFKFVAIANTVKANVFLSYPSNPPTNITGTTINIIGTDFPTITYTYQTELQNIELDIPAGNLRTIEIIVDTVTYVYRGRDVRNYYDGQDTTLTVDITPLDIKVANVNVSYNYSGAPPTNVNSIIVNIIGDNFPTMTKLYSPNTQVLDIGVPAGNSRTVEVIVNSDTAPFTRTISRSVINAGVYRGLDIRDYVEGQKLNYPINLTQAATNFELATVNLSIDYLGGTPANIENMTINIIGLDFPTISETFSSKIDFATLTIPAGNQRTIEIITNTNLYLYRGIDKRSYNANDNLSFPIILSPTNKNVETAIANVYVSYLDQPDQTVNSLTFNIRGDDFATMTYSLPGNTNFTKLTIPAGANREIEVLSDTLQAVYRGLDSRDYLGDETTTFTIDLSKYRTKKAAVTFDLNYPDNHIPSNVISSEVTITGFDFDTITQDYLNIVPIDIPTGYGRQAYLTSTANYLYNIINISYKGETSFDLISENPATIPVPMLVDKIKIIIPDHNHCRRVRFHWFHRFWIKRVLYKLAKHYSHYSNTNDKIEITRPYRIGKYSLKTFLNFIHYRKMRSFKIMSHKYHIAAIAVDRKTNRIYFAAKDHNALNIDLNTIGLEPFEVIAKGGYKIYAIDLSNEDVVYVSDDDDSDATIVYFFDIRTNKIIKSFPIYY